MFLNLHRLPTASVLIRIVKNEGGENAEYIEPGQYADHVYNNQYYYMSADDQILMNVRRKRTDYKAAKIAKLVCDDMNIKVSQDEQIKYLEKLIEDESKGAPLLDMNYFSYFEPEIGFRINLEAINNLKDKGFFGCIASLNPEATFYSKTNKQMPSDSMTFEDPDYKSMNTQYMFDDGDIVMKGYAP
jgi:hypothetical protein